LSGAWALVPELVRKLLKHDTASYGKISIPMFRHMLIPLASTAKLALAEGKLASLLEEADRSQQIYEKALVRDNRTRLSFGPLLKYPVIHEILTTLREGMSCAHTEMDKMVCIRNVVSYQTCLRSQEC